MRWALAAIYPLSAFCLPIGGSLSEGNAGFRAPSAQILEITASNNTILEWKDFSIEPNECVRFIQPDASCSVLNRVLEETPSRLLGRLEANGQVFLINPSGIITGRNAQIHTGNFVASALDINLAVFREKGELHFTEGLGAILHEGGISVNGFAYLIGKKIDCKGQIDCSAGGLFAAKSIEIGINGSLINIAPADQIIFTGEMKGKELLVLGDIIDIEGKLFGSTSINVGGKNFPASLTYIGPNALLEASAGASGNGGNILIWGERATQFYGEARARGGSSSGDGGTIEVSSPSVIEYHGRVDTRAPFGIVGNFILDPCDITIDTAVPLASIPVFTPTYTPGVNTTTVSTDDILTALGASNVSLNTSPGVGGAGDILWLPSLPLNYASTFSLTFNADNNVQLQSDIINAAAGDIIINAGGSVTIGDAFNPDTAVISTDGNILVNCVTGFTLIAGNGGTANASLTATGIASVTVTNGNVLLDSFTNTDATGLRGSPLIVSVPQGGIDIIADNTGTTGISSNDYFSLIARDSITFFSGTSGRNEGATFGSGTMCLIESLTADVLFQNPSGQRLRYLPNFPLTIRAARDVVIEGGGTITQIQTGTFPLIIEAGRDATLNAPSNIGPLLLGENFTCTAGRDILLNQSLDGTLLFLYNSGISFTAGSFFTATQSGTVNTLTATTTGGPFTITSGDSTLLNVTDALDLIFDTGSGVFTIDAGANIVYQSTSTGLVSTTGGQGINLESAANINLFDLSRVFSNGTDIFLRANININMSSTSLIDMLAPPIPGSTVTLIVDNDFPASPLFGSGAFIMNTGAIIMSVERPPIAIYTSRQQYNLISGSINGSFFSPGTLFVNTDQERWCTYFPNGFNTVPFRVHYKECLQELVDQAQIIIDESLADLHPADEYPGWLEEFSLSTDTEDPYQKRFYLRRRQLKLFNHPKSYTTLTN